MLPVDTSLSTTATVRTTPLPVRVWTVCLFGPVLSVASAPMFGDRVFPDASPGLLIAVLLLFWLPHGLGFPMMLFQDVVDSPTGRGLRRRVVFLSLTGVAAALLCLPLLP